MAEQTVNASSPFLDVLVDVDTQHDFCAPGGALFVRGADGLSGAFGALTAAGLRRGAMILGSVDSHAFDAWEFAGAEDAGPNGERPGFPPHCVKGTAGWLKVPGTTAPRVRFLPNAPLAPAELDRVVTKGAPQQLLFEKEVYSLFANPNAEAVLERVVPAGARPRFFVYGVALDYCVRAAALGLVDWLARRGAAGGEVLLVADATASVVPEGGEKALTECAAKGVRTIPTSEALTLLGSAS